MWVALFNQLKALRKRLRFPDVEGTLLKTATQKLCPSFQSAALRNSELRCSINSSLNLQPASLPHKFNTGQHPHVRQFLKILSLSLSLSLLSLSLSLENADWYNQYQELPLIHSWWKNIILKPKMWKFHPNCYLGFEFSMPKLHGYWHWLGKIVYNTDETRHHKAYMNMSCDTHLSLLIRWHMWLPTYTLLVVAASTQAGDKKRMMCVMHLGYLCASYVL